MCAPQPRAIRCGYLRSSFFQRLFMVLGVSVMIAATLPSRPCLLTILSKNVCHKKAQASTKTSVSSACRWQLESVVWEQEFHSPPASQRQPYPHPSLQHPRTQLIPTLQRSSQPGALHPARQMESMNVSYVYMHAKWAVIRFLVCLKIQ